MAKKQPPQQPPPVQRLNVQYSKLGRARFASHRDFSRALERALRRGHIPMAYSSGFHPHPRISYAGAAPTGDASHAEYVELGLARECDPDEVARALHGTLPDGFDVVAVAVTSGTKLTRLLEASLWSIEFEEAGDLAERATAIREADSVEIRRITKEGERTVDARPAILSLEVDGATLTASLRHTQPLIRPGDLASAVAPGVRYHATRLAQGPLSDGGIILDPLAD